MVFSFFFFVLNIVFINANAFSFAYIVESIDLWHGRLRHVNFASIKKLKDLKLINARESHETGECLVCVENKYFKKPFKPVVIRSTELLELIHYDLTNLKNTTSRGVKIIMYLLLMTSLDFLRSI